MEKDNKAIFSYNLNRLMELHGKSRNDISEALGISYFTVTAWTNGTKYPRIGKVEMLANYFGVQKSDLIEEYEDTEHSIPPDKQQLTEGEEMLLDLFRLVPEGQQQMVLDMIRVALNRKE